MNMSNYTQHLKSKKMYTLQLGTIYTNHNSFSPGGPIPHNHGEDRFGPPSLECSGSEHREGAVTSPLPEEEGLREKVEPSLERGTG